MTYSFSADVLKANADNEDFTAAFGEDSQNGTSQLEVTAANILNQLETKPVREHRFDPIRKWRFDFAYPDLMIAVEIEGGTRGNGRHNRHEGFTDDCEKYNTAGLMGWAVLRFTSEMVMDGRLKATVKRALAKEQKC